MTTARSRVATTLYEKRAMRESRPTSGPMPRIRLVGAVADSVDAYGRSQAHPARRADTTEREAVGSTDPRWILAAQAADRLGPGGMLTPEDRDALTRRAGHLGIGSFDAALIFAIVQDAGRRGQPGLSRSTAERLAMVGGAGRRPKAAAASSTLWVLGLGAVMFWIMVYWLTGAVTL